MHRHKWISHTGEEGAIESFALFWAKTVEESEESWTAADLRVTAMSNPLLLLLLAQRTKWMTQNESSTERMFSRSSYRLSSLLSASVRQNG